MSIDIRLHKKQGALLATTASEILYGGAAGGGKSYLMRAMAILACMSVANIQVYIFRKHYGDLYKNHMEGSGSFPEMLSPLAGFCRVIPSRNEIVFGNGAKIHLCHLQYEKDLGKYQGAEINLLLIDEATHFSEREYRFLRNRVRLGGLKIPDQLPFKATLPIILCGSNPGGVGHNWVKRTFVDAGEYTVTNAPKSEGGMTRAYIPARLEDNPTLLENDPEYESRLEGLGDPALIRAMRLGDWNIVAGGALDDVWCEEVIVPRFSIPAEWKIDRSFDWGSSHPFSVGWWAESNGEAVAIDNQLWEFEPGTIIRFAEWYGTKRVGSNEGLKLSATEIADGIIERENEMIESGWIASAPEPGPADGQIYQVTQKDVATIAGKMKARGVEWRRADKSPGSRVNGLELLRGRLKAVEGPGIYFMENCRATITTLPVLPRCQRNPEDVDTNAEDHIYDEVRYRVLDGRQAPASNIQVNFFGA